MNKEFIEAYGELLSSIARIPSVIAIGKTGGESMPDDDESDIDIMIFCDPIPSAALRGEAVRSVGRAVTQANLDVDDSPYWGVVDFASLNGAEVCLMYHNFDAMNAYLSSMLRGERLEKEGGFFYPTGRIASLLSLHLYIDKGDRLASLRDQIREMPPSLSRKLAVHHARALRDNEDFRRAVQRREILFYHCALEDALDHFLQALFALNRVYFPSRKRTEQYLDQFEKIPADCSARLARVIQTGVQPETLAESYALWGALVSDLTAMVDE